MARSDPQVNLRISAELKERIEAAAAKSKRSMNAEIAERLERSFDVPRREARKDDPPLTELDEAAERAVWRILESRAHILDEPKEPK